jgi:hypothetical protein
VTRPHADVDVAVWRDAQGALHDALPAWELRAVVGGALVPWARGVWLAPPTHEVQARPPAGTAGPDARAPARRARRDELGVPARSDGSPAGGARDARRPGGVRVLAPEVVLLYKSKAPRASDEHDFRVARPLLDAEARRWLRSALLRTATDPPWAAALALEP